MIWDDKGFLISKFRYNENSIIADFFTLHHGRCSGIIFGATSNKIKGYLQIGNLFQLNCSFKNESKIGSLKVEIDNFLNSELGFSDDMEGLKNQSKDIYIIESPTNELTLTLV